MGSKSFAGGLLFVAGPNSEVTILWGSALGGSGFGVCEFSVLGLVFRSWC